MNGGANQTVHTTSIEFGSTLALSCLERKYRLTLADITRCIRELRTFSDSLLNQYQHLDTVSLREDIRGPAKRCLDRLIKAANDQREVLGSTGLSLEDILALVWTGLTDSGSHVTSMDLDPKESFIRELRNIQVAYGVNNEGEEIASCLDGTVKGLLNSINGIHPLVNLDLINRDTVYSLMQLHAKTIFWESFCEKIRAEGFIVGQEIRTIFRG